MKTIFVLFALLLMACGPTAPNISGDAGGAGGAPSSSAGGSSGTGPVACGPGMKACADACAPIDSPATGCSGASCADCSYPNGTAACAGGACALASCVQGWADCDSATANGCEIHTATDPTHCGACSSPCSIPHATPSCMAGACQIGACAMGWADCNGKPLDGCETNVASNPATCGACSNTCAAGHGCAAGICFSCGASFSGGAGAAMSVTAAFPDQIAWKFVLPHDIIATAVVVPATSFNGATWTTSIQPDNGGKPGTPKLGSQTNLMSALKMPVALMAGVTYWITVGTSDPSPKIISVATVAFGSSPVTFWDGVLLSPVSPTQSASTFSINGACP